MSSVDNLFCVLAAFNTHEAFEGKKWCPPGLESGLTGVPFIHFRDEFLSSIPSIFSLWQAPRIRCKLVFFLLLIIIIVIIIKTHIFIFVAIYFEYHFFSRNFVILNHYSKPYRSCCVVPGGIGLYERWLDKNVIVCLLTEQMSDEFVCCHIADLVLVNFC